MVLLEVVPDAALGVRHALGQAPPRMQHLQRERILAFLKAPGLKHTQLLCQAPPSTATAGTCSVPHRLGRHQPVAQTVRWELV